MEKTRQRIAVFIAVISLVGNFSGPLFGQPCSGGTMAGIISPTIPWKTLPCVKGGEYYEFAAVAGSFYTFTFCMAGGSATWDTEVTILDNSGAYANGYGNDECFLQSDVR
ncbi:MAG TPA: hypothetical protein ENJ82_06830, partial [Bacteroidetes bacterium]|nr:hypothetical protein [Bacteroidota bacterium]